MNLDDLALFRMARARMDYASQRHTVLAQNIANADTPGWRARDVEEPDFARMARDAMQAPPRAVTTHPDHVAAGPYRSGPYREVTERHTFETSISGNPVVLEEQVQKMASGRSQYKLAVTLVQKHLKMLKTALGKNG